MSVYYLIYTSKITLPASFHHSTFYDICEQASRNNPKFGIGGFYALNVAIFYSISKAKNRRLTIYSQRY